LPPGLYRVPFAIVVPPTVAPTVEMKHGHISYRLLMEKVSGSFLPDVVSRDVVIRAPSFHPPLPLPPVGFQNLFKFDKGFFGTEHLHVHVTLRYPVFYLGYANQLGLGIVNNSKTEIKGIKVHLVGCAQYKAKQVPLPGQIEEHHHHNKDEDFNAIDIHNHQHVQIAPDRRVDLTMDLLTPLTVPPTLSKSMTHQIDVAYHLVVELVMAGMFSTPSVIKVPVTVSIPPREVLPILTGQVPHPSVAMGMGVPAGGGMGMAPQGQMGMGMPMGMQPPPPSGM